MSLTQKEREYVQAALDSGAKRLKTGPLSKSEAVSMGRDIVESRKETERQRKIAETIANKPDNYYITANPTPWDKAAQYHADKAKEAAEVGDKQAEDDEKAAARLYRGSEKYLTVLFDIA